MLFFGFVFVGRVVGRRGAGRWFLAVIVGPCQVGSGWCLFLRDFLDKILDTIKFFKFSNFSFFLVNNIQNFVDLLLDVSLFVFYVSETYA